MGKYKNSSSELGISVVIFIVVIVILLSVFGSTNLKYWFTYSLFPKENDSITVSVDKLENEWQQKLIINITNNTDRVIMDTSFYITADGKTKLISADGHTKFPNQTGWDRAETIGAIFPHKTITIETEVGAGESFFKVLDKHITKDFNIKTRVKTISFDKNLEDYNDGNYEQKTIDINNKSYSKIIILAIILAIMGLLYALDITDNLIIRIILGLGVVPLMAVLFAFMFIGARGGGGSSAPASSSNSSYEEQKRKRAAETYKREAVTKAGYERSGNKGEATRAQARMDAAMADMIGGNNKSASDRYKREAAAKAGYEARGNKAEAARAQARMDAAMADMIRDKE